MTAASMLSMGTLHDIEDSESDEDLDFGGYSSPKLQGLNQLSSELVKKSSSTVAIGSPKNKRKSTKQRHSHSITISSFQNFRIQSLTIISMDSHDHFDYHDNDEDDYKALELMGIFEEKEVDFDDEKDAPIVSSEPSIVDLMMSDLGSLRLTKSQQKSLTDSVSEDEQITSQLMAFGYKHSEIITAMESATNCTDINEIKNILDDTGQSEHDLKAQQRLKNRQFIEQEIIKTEQSYCLSLDILINELIQGIFENEYVDKKYYDQIRSTLPKISAFHHSFLEKLSNPKHGSLIEVFNECFMKNKQNVIDIYTQYIQQYDVILDLFGITFHGNYKLDTFLRQKRKEKKPLSCFLILPGAYTFP